MVANPIPEVFQGSRGSNGSTARAETTATPQDRPEGERAWVQLPGSCNMVLDVPEALMTEILRTQAHAAQQRAQAGRGEVDQLLYSIRTTMLVRRVPADGSAPERVCDLRMFISTDERGRVSYEGTFGLFRMVMSTVLEQHIARLAEAAEAE